MDAVVYTRYILSIFQQDSFDLEQDPELMAAVSQSPPTSTSTSHPHHLKMGHAHVDGSTGGGGGGFNTGNTHQHYHHHHAMWGKRDKGRGRLKGKNQHLRWQTPEDLKKDAVVKCLQSVTEKDCGIEGLVEELCLKLKKVQEEREECATPSHSPDATSHDSNQDGASKTERYYQAFPALSDKSGVSAADIKPKGAWKSKPNRNNSTGSISNPSSDRELESLPDKSVSASVSRHSNSPVGFQGRQYQRAQSLPSSLSRNQSKSPTFVVPKYQGRKGHHRTYAHIQEKGTKRHQRDREWGGRGAEKGDGKYKNVPNRKPGSMFPEWYNESGEGQADLTLILDGRETGQTIEADQEVFMKENPVNGDPAVKEEERLEEAVNTMAESLCRSIMEECDDDRPLIKSSSIIHGLLPDDREMYMFGSEDSLKDWYAGSTRTTDFEHEVSMAPIVVDGQGHPSSSIWEKNLVPGSPSCVSQQEPWGNNARSCLPTESSTSGNSTPAGGAADLDQAGSDPTSPKSLMEESAVEESSDTTSMAEELRVDIDHHNLDSAPISPRNAPIGTGRNPDSLLRICDHTHAHSHSYDPQGPSTPSATGWGISSDGSQGPLHSTPAVSGVPSDQSFSADEDSLVQGICSSQRDGSLLNISSEAHSLDMNNALWSTYENKHPQIHPPKIVTWDESIFSGFQPLSKVSAFIEGGVYGSPYSSQNNSQFNSCSTSPCNDSSIRELWEGSHSREASSVCSLECLLSPQPCGTSCSSIKDEQSVIEDSLVDSPKYLCSRSSSRFDFARSDAENSDNSSAHGTETDEMISEDEWVEEVPRDASKIDVKDKAAHQSDSDRTPADSTPDVVCGGSLISHQGSTDNSHQGSSANSQQGFSGTSIGSGKGTVISQHLSANWKPPEVSSFSPDLIRALPIQSSGNSEPTTDRPFISTDSHFKPIQQTASTNTSEAPSDENQDGFSTKPIRYTGSSSRALGNYGVASQSCYEQGSDSNKQWMHIQESAPQLYPYTDSSLIYEDKTVRNVNQTPQMTMTSTGFYAGYPGSILTTGSSKYFGSTGDHGVPPGKASLSGAGIGAGADTGDPGGGPVDQWGYYGARSSEMQLNPDSQFFLEDDDSFVHEGLLVDQPLESHPSQRKLGRFKRRSGTHSVCKEFLEGCCTNSMCGYSHDTSHVTCGQWLEGRCRSGVLCKFMHGHTSNMSSQNSSRAGSRTGSTDEAEDASWDQHQRPAYPQVPDLMRLPGNHGHRGVDTTRASSSPRDGGGGEHMRSLPINISSKSR